MPSRSLRPSLSLPEIYLYRGITRAPVDFRKQAQGLAVLVEQELGHNPFTGALYAFINKQPEQDQMHDGQSAFAVNIITTKAMSLSAEASYQHQLFRLSYRRFPLSFRKIARYSIPEKSPGK